VESRSAPVNRTLLKKAQATALSISSLTGNPIRALPPKESPTAKMALTAIALVKISRTSAIGCRRARKNATAIDTRNKLNMA